MAADQAAGLRRRQTARAAPCIHLHSPQSATAHRLLEALSRQGLDTLLIDAQGRHLGHAPRSLFDWRQQLARRQLHLHALPAGTAWHAPGVETDTAALAMLSARHDCLVVDHPLDMGSVAALPSPGHVRVLDVSPADVKPAYRLLKTLAHLACGADILLLGEAAACAQLEAACRQFLDAKHAQRIGSLAQETDAFAALAVRMAGEETGPQAVT